MIYLDNAATTSPKPKCVLQSVMCGLRISANPGRSGHDMSQIASEQVYNTRKKLADFFNCPAIENVIFTQNCTQSLNTAIMGAVKRGDHVITSCLEHNSVMRVLHRLSKDGVINYDVATVYTGDDIKTVSSFASKIRRNTSLIVCTHASNVFGTVLPIEDIGILAKGYGLKFIVDGAQTAGTLEIDMKKMHIDALCIPGHKGLYGAMGTGALLISEGMEILPLIVGGTGSESMNLEQPKYYPDRLESGTLNLPGIMSIGSGVDFVRNISLKKIHEYEMKLCNELYDHMHNIKDIKIYSSNDSDHTVPIFTFNYKDVHSEEISERLNRCGICVRSGYHCSYSAHKAYRTDGQGAVRVSFGIFNTEKDIKNFINCINKIEKI